MTLPRKPSRGQTIRADLIGQIIDYMRESTPVRGPNILVSRTPGGSVLSVKPGGAGGPASGTAPWTVRKHVTEDDENRQWEIWLPTGCMSVGGTLTPINLAASAVSGHGGDKPGWYLLKLDEEEGAADTSTDGDGESQVTTSYRIWDIVAHAKTSAKVDGVDELSAPARRLLYVSARKRLTPEEASSQTDAQMVADSWGDEYSQVVAVVTVGTRQQGQGSAQPFRQIVQAASAPISVQGRSASGFDLVWYFSVNTTDGGISVARLFCVRQIATAAGFTLRGPQMTEVALNAQTIYAKVLTNPLRNSSYQNQIEVVVDPSGQYPAADNFVTWLLLYSMKSNAVDADYRATALANIQVYR